MKSLKTIGGLVFAALTTVTGTASAALTGPVTINFNSLSTAIYGHPNLTPTGTGACPNGDPCYIESGVVFGTPFDPTLFFGGGVHLHPINYQTGNMGLEYHSDSSGIYVRLKDGAAFNLNSMVFRAPISPDNPDSGANNSWVILGFSNAINPTVTTDAAYPTLVASYTVPNGWNNGTLTLPGSFHNIKSLWIHYNGYPTIPVDPDAVYDPDTGEALTNGPLQAKSFMLVIDNVALSPPLTPAQQVECLLDWAEQNYAVLFGPTGQVTTAWKTYMYRYYAGTNSYLGVSSANNHVYYQGADGRMRDVGTLASWLPLAGCQ